MKQEMKGSEKQIQWANGIKGDLIDELDNLENDIVEYLALKCTDPTPDDYAEVMALTKLAINSGGYKAAIEAIKNCDEARWFIDYGRSGVISAVLKAMSGHAAMGGLI